MDKESTKISVTIQRALTQELLLYPNVGHILQKIHEATGRVLLVGGAVRDLFLGQPCKDLDIEIYGLESEKVESILKRFGSVFTVGKAFGVFRISGIDIDWSLPRYDSAGRKPMVHINPNMSFEDAFARRDLTINALGIDLISYELIDPFNGVSDIEHKVLRCPDTKLFIEDPLRFYRVMQFIGRFEMYPDIELNHLCATMDITDVSIERIEVEFQKLLLRSRYPSLGIRWLAAIGRLPSVLPELAATIGIEQDATWHPEGDVFEHSMQVLDASVFYTYDDVMHTLALRYAALCHDLGKVTTTKRHEDGKITSYGHELVSAQLTKIVLKRIMRTITLLDCVVLLVRHHMAPGQFIASGAKMPAYKRLAQALYPQATLAMLADLSCADKCGRNPHDTKPFKQACSDVEEFRLKAIVAQVILAPEEPLLKGRDLLDKVAPGAELGRMLDYAYQIQIEHSITDKQELKKRVLDFFTITNK